MRSARLANKPDQKYGLFAKISLYVIGTFELAKNPPTFLNIENQYIKEINRHFNGTLNNFSHMLSAENQKQDESYTFKEMLL